MQDTEHNRKVLKALADKLAIRDRITYYIYSCSCGTIDLTTNTKGKKIIYETKG